MGYGLLALSLLIWCDFPPATRAAQAAADPIKAGVARELFTLPEGVPLAGYSRRHGKPSRGLHDPVGVSALVLTDADTTAALVSCDLLIIDEPLFDAVRRRLPAAGVPADLSLMLAATHTHSGPGGYGMKFLEKLSMGHFDRRIFDALVRTITQAISRAYAARVPVRLAYRRAATEGLVVNRIDPRGPVDRDLTVVAVYPEASAGSRDAATAARATISIRLTEEGSGRSGVSGFFILAAAVSTSAPRDRNRCAGSVAPKRPAATSNALFDRPSLPPARPGSVPTLDRARASRPRARARIRQAARARRTASRRARRRDGA